MSSYMEDLRRRVLLPLCDKSIQEIDNIAWSMCPAQAREVVRAMDSCTKTNCWWVEYRVARAMRYSFVSSAAARSVIKDDGKGAEARDA